MRARTIFGSSILAAGLALAAFVGCENKHEAKQEAAATGNLGASASIAELMKARGLSEADVEARSRPTCRPARWTSTTSSRRADSRATSIVIGVPSMRMLKVIGVFTPEPWQGYGFGGDSDKVLEGGNQGTPQDPLGRHAPPESLGDEGRLRRPVPLRERQGERARRGRRPRATSRPSRSSRTRSSRATTAAPSSRPTPTTSSRRASTRRRSGATTRRSRSTRTSTAASRSSGSSTAARAASIPRRVLGDRAAAVHAGPRRRRQARQRRLGVHQLVQHRDGHRRQRWRASRRSSPAPRRTTWTSSTSSTGRRPRSSSTPARRRRSPGMRVLHDGRERPREACSRSSPSRRARTACDVTPDGKDIVVGGKLDTHATVYDFAKIKALIDEKKFEGKDAYGVADPRRSRTRSAARSRSASGRCTPSFDDKGIAYTSLFIESRVAKWSLKDLKARREAAGPLQHRPHPRGRGRHRQPRRQVRGRDEQDVDRPLPPGGPALSAELPAHRHRRRQDAKLSRHADRHRRAALRADDQGRQDQADQGLHARARTPSPSEKDPLRGRGRQGAHRAQRQRGRTST